MTESVFLDCLTTRPNDTGLQPIKESYLIPTKLQGHNAVTQLEYHWGMEKGQLSLRSPLNMVHLSSDMEENMSRGGWTLSPPMALLKDILRMQNYNSRKCKGYMNRRRVFTEVFPVGIYEYDFIPLKFNKPIFVRRLDASGRPAYTRYDSPYVNFPRIKSHAHPFFVLYSSNNQMSLAPTIDVPMDRLMPTMEINQLWFLRVDPEFHTQSKSGSTTTHPPRKDGSSPCSGVASPIRGVKRPHADDEEEDEEEEEEAEEDENSQEEVDDDDEDEEESSIIPTTTPPASDSIRTPKDSSTPPSPPCKRLKLDLSVLGSDIFYNSKSLLRWIRDSQS